MINLLVLDTGVLGMVTNPKASEPNEAARKWLRERIADGATIVIPEIVDYELRRELLRENKTAVLARLDALKASFEFLSINNATMIRAAELWAKARGLGKPTSPDAALDGDMILVAQTLLETERLESHSMEVAAIIATTNVKHLSIFATAAEWHRIT